mmetsp:Transcript_16395/g.18501  ORF Transcript_16395/g.18501 Transcript_16395/m.18501 type:complete len:85 (-) Transcript_16395:211-465(-)
MEINITSRNFVLWCITGYGLWYAGRHLSDLFDKRRKTIRKKVKDLKNQDEMRDVYDFLETLKEDKEDLNSMIKEIDKRQRTNSM